MSYIVEPIDPGLTPAPVPRGRLLAVAPEWQPGDARWHGGVTWLPFDSRTGLTVNPVEPCDVDFAATPSRTCMAPVEAKAFRLSDAMRGAALEYEPADLSMDVAERMSLFRSAAVARELIGPASSGGRSLSTDAAAPAGYAFGSAAVSAVEAIAVFERHLALALRGGRGMIHITPGLLPYIVDAAIVSVGDHWETPTGHVVVADAGYVDAAAPTGQSASAAGTDWVYATGPVKWHIGTQATLSVDGDGFEYARNEHDVLGEEYGILLWEPLPVAALLVSYDQTV